MNNPKPSVVMKRPEICLNRCPKCAGSGRIWDFGDPDEPTFYYCELCSGEFTLNS